MQLYPIVILPLLIFSTLHTGLAYTPDRDAYPLELQNGANYLKNNFNETYQLIHESPDDMELSRTYWIVKDNWLASYALEPYYPELAGKLRASIEKHGYSPLNHYIEVLMGVKGSPPIFKIRVRIIEEKYQGEPPELVYRLKTEERINETWNDLKDYCDLVLYQALYSAYSGDLGKAEEYFNMALSLWDGKGFRDKAYNEDRYYSTYKLALFHYVARVLGKEYPFKDRLLYTIFKLQAPNGGFYTHYDNNGDIQPHGFTNTETTSYVLLALTFKPKPLPHDHPKPEENPLALFLILLIALGILASIKIRVRNKPYG